MCLLLATSAPFLCVVLVMNTSERMGTSLVHSARLDTRGTEVCELLFCFLFFGDSVVVIEF